GGPTTGLKVGGIDQPVITDPLGIPYIPGSSLKGKLRNLIEKKEKVKLNKSRKRKLKDDTEVEEFYGHECDNIEDYKKCPVCRIWGTLSSEKIINEPTFTRLFVRDTFLFKESITEEMKRNLELEYTEVKVETAIDRVKGTALRGSLRPIDRVPPGAIFRPMEMIYNVFEESDKDLLIKVFEAMELLEHDYLGGMGSRGYGKIEFDKIEIYWNSRKDYESGKLNENKINDETTEKPADIVKNFEKIREKIKNENI
ncbi:MAG: type III-A CRISPR-associated RAMP protein Csm3, partial [Candidatus Ratteibacteria bacterium]